MRTQPDRGLRKPAPGVAQRDSEIVQHIHVVGLTAQEQSQELNAFGSLTLPQPADDEVMASCLCSCPSGLNSRL